MKITEKLKMIIKCALALDVKEISTDKGILLYDAEEIKEGVEVFIKDETEELKPAEDGTYAAEDGTIYEVAEGKISTITPKEEEVKEEIKEEVKAESEEVIVEPIEDEGKEEEKVDIETAIKDLTEKVAKMTEALTEITNSLNALKGEYEELKAKVEKLEGEPAAEPIEEVVVEEPVKASRMSYLKKK